MDLRGLPGLAEDYPAYRELKKQVAQGGVTQIEGLPVPAKGWLLAQLGRETNRPLVVVTYNAEQAQRLCADLARYGVAEDELASLVSSTETLIFAEGAPDLGQLGMRRRYAGIIAPLCQNIKNLQANWIAQSSRDLRKILFFFLFHNSQYSIHPLDTAK